MMTGSDSPITPRELAIDETAASPFDTVGVARSLLHTVRRATIATIDPGSGYPYGMVTNLAVLPDGAPFFFVAGISLHARNLDSDNRAAVALAPEGPGDVLTLPRLTLVGRVGQITGEAFAPARSRYLARYPKSKLYLALPDARLYRLDVESLKLNGGPARNAAQVTPADLAIDLTDADPLLAAEAQELERINALDGEASRLAVLAGEKPGRWRVTGIDPAGLDLVSREAAARLWFPFRVHDPAHLRDALRQ